MQKNIWFLSNESKTFDENGFILYHKVIKLTFLLKKCKNANNSQIFEVFFFSNKLVKM